VVITLAGVDFLSSCYLCRSFEASAYPCSSARRIVLFFAVGFVCFFHWSLKVVYFLWPCFGLSTFHTC